MRVIAGSARHLRLKTIDGLDTRPTTDRIKETLFNVIQNNVPGSNFLDLFSGSGAIGIEALSRGANQAVLVENNPKAINCINENLAFTKLADKAKVMPMNVSNAIANLEGGNYVFDVVYMDPPYNNNHERNVLEQLNNSSIINQDTLIIIEASLDTDNSFVDGLDFEIVREKTYKTNKHFFVKKIGD